MAKYKWASPHDWLGDKIEGWTPEQVKVAFVQVAFLHDSDTLQDLVENEMDEDGYFKEVTLDATEPVTE